MLVSVPLHLDTLSGKPKLADLETLLNAYYKGSQLVSVVAGAAGKVARLEAEALNCTDKLDLFVFGKPALIGLSHGVTWDDRPGALRSRVKRAIARMAFRRADAFVANDTFFLREMGLDAAPRQRMFQEVAPGRWFIPNCVNAERFRRSDGLADLRRLRPIIVPRNLYHNRGVHLAIAAFDEFARNESDAALVIVGGTGQPGYVDRLRRQVAESPARDRIVFWGSVAHDAMPDVYSSAELTLIPSLCGEGTSLSALESMAAGTAVISTDAGGLPDLPAVQCRPDTESLLRAMREVWPRRAEVAAEQQAEVLGTYTMANWQEAWVQAIKGARPVSP
jgi:glycosyltransferase involved in cell wall biosynthesis